MAAGGSFNSVYDYFNKNSEDIIILTIDVSVRDDSAKIVNTYKANGATPRFPIVLATGNSKEMSTLYGAPGTGGPTYILHPDREIKNCSYGEVTMRLELEKALADDCDDGGTDIMTLCKHKEMFNISIKQDILSITPRKESDYSISLINIHGQELMQFHSYASGNNPIELNLLTVADATFFIRIEDSEQLVTYKILH